MCEMTFPDTTSFTPPVQKLKTKCAQKGRQKRKMSTLDDSYTTPEPSFLEHVDAQLFKLRKQNLHYIKKKVCVVNP